MINQTDLDLRQAEYFTRATRIDREGWMTEGTALPETLHDQGRGPVIERMRRRFGETLITLGERAKGTSTDHTTTSGYGPAI